MLIIIETYYKRHNFLLPHCQTGVLSLLSGIVSFYDFGHLNVKQTSTEFYTVLTVISYGYVQNIGTHVLTNQIRIVS